MYGRITLTMPPAWNTTRTAKLTWQMGQLTPDVIKNQLTTPIFWLGYTEELCIVVLRYKKSLRRHIDTRRPIITTDGHVYLWQQDGHSNFMNLYLMAVVQFCESYLRVWGCEHLMDLFYYENAATMIGYLINLQSNNIVSPPIYRCKGKNSRLKKMRKPIIPSIGGDWFVEKFQ